MHHARRPLPDSTAPYRLYTDHAMDHAPRLAITWTSGQRSGHVHGHLMATDVDVDVDMSQTNMVARRTRRVVARDALARTRSRIMMHRCPLGHSCDQPRIPSSVTSSGCTASVSSSAASVRSLSWGTLTTGRYSTLASDAACNHHVPSSICIGTFSGAFGLRRSSKRAGGLAVGPIDLADGAGVHASGMATRAPWRRSRSNVGAPVDSHGFCVGSDGGPSRRTPKPRSR